jgi:hypothetical protein
MTRRHHEDGRPTPQYAHGATNSCPTGKIAFHIRSDAKRNASRMRRLGIHVRPYRCQLCDLFHLGHLPQATLTGAMSASDVYAPRGAAANG